MCGLGTHSHKYYGLLSYTYYAFLHVSCLLVLSTLQLGENVDFPLLVRICLRSMFSNLLPKPLVDEIEVVAKVFRTGEVVEDEDVG